MPVRIWLGGEGSNDFGVLEALLRRARPDGWIVAERTVWSSLRSFEAGRARREPRQHGDRLNIHKLAEKAYEDACEVMAFVRDVDADPSRAAAISSAIVPIATLWQAEFHYALEVIGGPVLPSLEGWLLALQGEPNTDDLTKAAAETRIDALGILKSTSAYVAIVETATLGEPPTFDLPPGTASLQQWLARAREVLNALVDGRRDP